MQDYQLTQASSGIRVVTESLPGVRSISLGYWVGTGSRFERPDQAGISHFLEHLLFKGTEQYDATDIAELFDSIGAEINAFTAKEQTVLHCRFLDEHLERAFGLTCEMLLQPAYREIDVEREVILEEIAMYEDEPQDKVHDVFATALFGDHPLGRPVIGSSQVISSVTTEAIDAYHRDRYAPENIVVAAAGNLEHAQLLELVERNEREKRAERGADTDMSAPGRKEPQALFFEKETDQYYICLGGPGISRRDERRYALGILDSILGGSVSSRLFQAIREKRGLAYVIYSFAEQYCDTGYVGIYVGTRPDNVVEVMRLIATELERLQDDPATDEELERAKENFKGRFVLSMESTQARMNRLGRSVLGDVELHTLDEIIAKIDAVDIQALAELVGELYRPEMLSAAAIGSGEELFLDSLAQVSPQLTSGRA